MLHLYYNEIVSIKLWGGSYLSQIVKEDRVVLKLFKLVELEIAVELLHGVDCSYFN